MNNYENKTNNFNNGGKQFMETMANFSASDLYQSLTSKKAQMKVNKIEKIKLNFNETFKFHLQIRNSSMCLNSRANQLERS